MKNNQISAMGYGFALVSPAVFEQSLQNTTLTPEQIDNAMLNAKLNQQEYGLNGNNTVPRIPGRINQVKS